MTDAKKFMFDTHDFNKVKTVNATIYTEEQLVLAKEQSFALGKNEGLQEAKQQQEERLIGLLQKTLAIADTLSAAEERREISKYADAAKVALRVIRKLMPKFSSQYALPEIENVVSQTLDARKDEPRIAVIVPTVHLEALKARLDALAIERGYAGRVILLADDALPPTDCRVEWADGGAERLYEQLFSHLDTEITKAISGINASLNQK